jgi:hypothetical protein
MSAPVKPAMWSRSSIVNSGAQDALPELTQAEQSLLRHFRTMDDWGRAHVSNTAERQAKNYPYRVAPSLRLITGGAA